MRLLLVGAGASYSTKDVEDGYLRALRAAGHQVTPWLLDARIDHAGRFLNYEYRLAKRGGANLPKPTSADVLYKAQQGILERALRLQVDGVLFVCGMYVLRDTLELLRRAHVPTAMILTESPYDDGPQAGHASLVDVAWTNERSSVEVLRRTSGNPRIHYLAPAYDAQVHQPAMGDPDTVASHDVVFVGTCFPERIDLLGAVDWTGIDLGLYGYWTELPSRHKLRRYLRGGVTDNAQAVQLYRNARIGLNLYRTRMGFEREQPEIGHAESVNPRALELAASGCFQISHHRAEAAEIFGWSVPTFTTAAELEDLVRYWLPAEQARADAAIGACRRVRGHTFDDRVAQLIPQLEAAWPLIPERYAALQRAA